MALQPGVDTTLEVSASTPASETESDYGALSYTKVGKIESIGAGGKQRQEITFTDLETGEEEVFGGSISFGSRTLGIGHVDSDAGQGILETAFDNNTKVAVKITLGDGAIRYFTARVMSYNDQGYTANEVIMLECGLRQVTEAISVAAP